MIFPDEAGIGETPPSLTNAASERTRSGLSCDDEYLRGDGGADAERAATKSGAVCLLSSPGSSRASDLGVELEPAARWRLYADELALYEKDGVTPLHTACSRVPEFPHRYGQHVLEASADDI